MLIDFSRVVSYSPADGLGDYPMEKGILDIVSLWVISDFLDESEFGTFYYAWVEYPFLQSTAYVLCSNNFLFRHS